MCNGHTVNFRLVVQKIRNAKLQKVSRDLNPPIESKLSRNNLDSIGGFKSRDTLQFCIPSLDGASNLKNTVQWVYNGLLSPCDARSIEAMFVLLK